MIAHRHSTKSTTLLLMVFLVGALTIQDAAGHSLIKTTDQSSALLRGTAAAAAGETCDKAVAAAAKAIQTCTGKIPELMGTVLTAQTATFTQAIVDSQIKPGGGCVATGLAAASILNIVPGTLAGANGIQSDLTSLQGELTNFGQLKTDPLRVPAGGELIKSAGALVKKATEARSKGEAACKLCTAALTTAPTTCANAYVKAEAFKKELQTMAEAVGKLVGCTATEAVGSK